MFLIAHRGNFEGPCPEYENCPKYLLEGLVTNNVFHMEIDVWKKNGQLYLGHNAPNYKVNDDFIVNSRFWCHAKNLEAFEHMLNRPLVHCFWHQEDDFVLTSRGYIWTYPGKTLTSKSIYVMPEQCGFEELPFEIAGICSDFINNYK